MNGVSRHFILIISTFCPETRTYGAEGLEWSQPPDSKSFIPEYDGNHSAKNSDENVLSGPGLHEHGEICQIERC